MTERPIIFSGPMVRAILEGRKTQTRRVIKPQPENDGSGGVGREADSWIWRGGRRLLGAFYGADYVHTGRAAMERAMEDVAPFEKGDRLWVRETWRVSTVFDDTGPSKIRRTARISYCADEEAKGCSVFGKRRPAIFMPRWASRLTLEVVSIRVERLQEIGDPDAAAEGTRCEHGFDYCTRGCGTPRERFAKLWDSINAKRAPWASHPWVWVVKFRVAR